MPIMSFGSQNINIITHKRAMTIRKLWKNPLKVGDRLHCYWNLVSKEKKKIFEAIVTVKPEVELGEYKGITLEKKEYPVTDEDVALPDITGFEKITASRGL